MGRPKIHKIGIKDVKFGKNVKINQPVNLYGCTIGDNCLIGPFVEIQDNVIVGDNCKIESHAFICSLVTIGDNCFISHGVKFINDKLTHGPRGGPAGGDVNKWEKTIIGNHVSIGTNATILPVIIADNVVIGAGAVVTKDINESGVYVGNPARKLRPL